MNDNIKTTKLEGDVLIQSKKCCDTIKTSFTATIQNNRRIIIHEKQISTYNIKLTLLPLNTSPYYSECSPTYQNLKNHYIVFYKKENKQRK